MFLDLLEYVSNPFPWHLAPMGYVREVRMTGRRAVETSGAWDRHLTFTRDAIRQSARHCQSRTRVVVVGAGNLLDVPLEVLTDMFDEVVLLDIIHPRATRKRALRSANIVLLDADVTGVARDVFEAVRRRDIRDLPRSTPPELGFDRIDLIVSVNLLSQLAVIPSGFIQGHFPAMGQERLAAFGKNLIEAHLTWLTQSADRVCLVTDVTRVEHFLDGSVLTKDIVEGVRLPRPDKTWDWHIAPQGSVYADRNVHHRVQAHGDFRLPAGS